MILPTNIIGILFAFIFVHLGGIWLNYCKYKIHMGFDNKVFWFYDVIDIELTY